MKPLKVGAETKHLIFHDLVVSRHDTAIAVIVTSVDSPHTWAGLKLRGNFVD